MCSVQHHEYELSAAQGSRVARRNEDSIAERMTPEQIDEAQRLVREWVEGRR